MGSLTIDHPGCAQRDRGSDDLDHSKALPKKEAGTECRDDGENHLQRKSCRYVEVPVGEGHGELTPSHDEPRDQEKSGRGGGEEQGRFATHRDCEEETIKCLRSVDGGTVFGLVKLPDEDDHSRGHDGDQEGKGVKKRGVLICAAFDKENAKPKKPTVIQQSLKRVSRSLSQ